MKLLAPDGRHGPEAADDGSAVVDAGPVNSPVAPYEL